MSTSANETSTAPAVEAWTPETPVVDLGAWVPGPLDGPAQG